MNKIDTIDETIGSRDLPNEVPRCEHVKFNGIRCGSPTMRNQHFCYHHARIRHTRPTNVMPVPDTAEAITYAAHGIMESMFAKVITPAEGRVLVAVLRLQLQALGQHVPARSSELIIEDANDARHSARIAEVGPGDTTGKAIVEVLKDRVRYG